MARAAITVQTVGSDGATISTEAAESDGNSIPANAETYIQVVNGSGASINVTIPATGYVDGEPVEDRVVAVGAGVTKLIAGLSPQVFTQSDGTFYINYSAVTTVTVAAFEIG